MSLELVMQQFQSMINPYGVGFKKYMLSILQERYRQHEAIIEKLSELVHSEKDYTVMGQLVLAVFEAGFMKSVEQHRELLEKIGLKPTVIHKAQSEKSG